MLTKFRIKNFKSFMNDTVIDLRKTKYKLLSDNNVAENDILKGLLFIGGNATGKTNIILSLQLLLKLLFHDNFKLFVFDKCLFCENNHILELEYEFLIDMHKINYFISYDFSKKILFENLKLDDNELINRQGKTGVSKINDYLTFNDLDDEHLLIREIYFNTKFRGNKILQKWFSFLQNSVYINIFKNKILCSTINSDNLLEYLDKNDVHEINNFFKKFAFDQYIEYSDEVKGSNVQIKVKKENEKNIFFRRTKLNTPIPFLFESLGNQNLVKLLPKYLNLIKNSGMLIIDEFSSGFHNKLEELLIKYFMKQSANSQIFIVSHSTNLLSNAILRPDQIYTVDFDPNTGSHIKRISEERPREAQNIEKMYLNGQFNGIPHFEHEI